MEKRSESVCSFAVPSQHPSKRGPEKGTPIGRLWRTEPSTLRQHRTPRRPSAPVRQNSRAAKKWAARAASRSMASSHARRLMHLISRMQRRRRGVPVGPVSNARCFSFIAAAIWAPHKCIPLSPYAGHARSPLDTKRESTHSTRGAGTHPARSATTDDVDELEADARRHLHYTY